MVVVIASFAHQACCQPPPPIACCGCCHHHRLPNLFVLPVHSSCEDARPSWRSRM